MQRASQIRSMPVTGESSCDSSDAEDNNVHPLPRGDQLTSIMHPLAATNHVAPPSPAARCFLTYSQHATTTTAFVVANNHTNKVLTPLLADRRHLHQGGGGSGALERRHTTSTPQHQYLSAASEATVASRQMHPPLQLTNRNLLPANLASAAGVRHTAKQLLPGFAYAGPAGGGRSL